MTSIGPRRPAPPNGKPLNGNGVEPNPFDNRKAQVVGGVYAAMLCGDRLNREGRSCMSNLSSVRLDDLVALKLFSGTKPTETEVKQWYEDRGRVWNPPRKGHASLGDLIAACAGISGSTAYTLAAVEESCGATTAEEARARVSWENRKTWASSTRNDRQTGRADLVTAAELITDYGVTPTDLASMTPATEEEEVEAAERLNRARSHYMKYGATEAISIADGVVPPSAMKDQAPPRQLIGHLIYQAQLAELIGEPGSGKTFVALGLSLSLASGRNLGIHRVPERVKVLYVAAEAPESVYLRALGWWFLHGIDPKTQDGWFTVYPQPLQLGDPEHMRQVVSYAKANGIGLVVFDTRALVTLGLDENSSGDQGLAIESCKALNRAGSAVLVVHHTPKDGTKGGGGRGSGAWFGAAYTSMYLEKVDKRDHLVCDKNKDRAGGCKHPLTYADMTLPPEWMPAAGSEEERSTRALTTVDPFTEDTGIGAHGLNKTQLSTLWVIANYGGAEGLTVSRLEALGGTTKDDDHEVGKQATIYRSLDALGNHVKVVKAKPKTWRVSDAGWDLLLDEGLVEKEFVDSHRHTVADLGSPPYLAAVDNIGAALDTLTEDGTILVGTSTMTDCKKLVQALMRDKDQDFGDEAWSQAYPVWKDGTA